MIIVDKAMFGRMELGRCVTRNYGHLGCSVDVLSYVDAACSGLRLCELSVSDPVLVRTKPCPPDFSSYLDATYRCVPGILKTTLAILISSLHLFSNVRNVFNVFIYNESCDLHSNHSRLSVIVDPSIFLFQLL